MAVKFFTKDKTLSLWNCSSLFSIPHFLCGRRNCTVIFNTQQASSHGSTQAQFCTRQYEHVFVNTAKQKLIAAVKRICNDLWNYSLEKIWAMVCTPIYSIGEKNSVSNCVFSLINSIRLKYYSSTFFQQKYFRLNSAYLWSVFFWSFVENAVKRNIIKTYNLRSQSIIF